jgi:hypothetical protein
MSRSPTFRLLPRRAERPVSAGERALGAVLLLLLAGVLVWFALLGSRPGPAAAPAAPGADTAPPTTDSPLDLRVVPSDEPEPEDLLPEESPSGWIRGEIEEYDVDGLFEKIDGKADSYIAFDVAWLTFATYADPEDPDRWADVYVYDMAEPLNAFGIYRAQRSGAEEPLPAGDEGGAAGGAAFARRGSYYVEVAGAGPALTEEVRELAIAVADGLSVTTAPVRIPDWFPAEGLSIVRYDLRSCLMVEALGDTFLAIYEDGAQAFVSRQADAAAATAAAEEARETFEFLGTPARLEVRGRYAVGVVGAPSPEREAALHAVVLERVGEGE